VRVCLTRSGDGSVQDEVVWMNPSVGERCSACPQGRVPEGDRPAMFEQRDHRHRARWYHVGNRPSALVTEVPADVAGLGAGARRGFDPLVLGFFDPNESSAMAPD
jgi:hypothetical protein